MILRPEQRTVVDQAKAIMKVKNIVYLACEVRVGKTIISLTLSKEIGWRKVCFITKLNAISSIQADYEKIGRPFEVFHVLNFEQAHKISDVYDGYIVDEAHSLGAYAKPSKRTKVLKELIGFKPVILMSGTPSPETPSQLYHQFWITQYGPWQEYTNFYKWAKHYVDVKKKFLNGYEINDYSRAKTEKVEAAVSPYLVRLSQQEAGFTSFVQEEILTVPIDSRLYKLMEILKKNKVYKLKNNEVILADTPVKLQSLFHQLSSGTVKIEDKRHILDESKAWFIKTRFAGQKIAIFYKFIAEGELLRKIFPNNTDVPEIFNRHSNIVFIKQCVSGREGSNLSTADCLVVYNIDFSATTYWQMRARMQSKERTKLSKLYWIFSENGIERFVHRAVSKKLNFTKQYFDKAMKEWSPSYSPELSQTSDEKDG